MPRKNLNSPPKVMTWKRAFLPLSVAAISDVLRYFFLFFWFFGPLLIGVLTADYLGGGWLAGGIGTLVGGTVGFFTGPALVLFGTVMSIAVDIFCILILIVLLLLTNTRIFKENPMSLLWVLLGLAASQLIMVWQLYRKQIKNERAAFKKWEQEQAVTQEREQGEQLAALMRARSAQAAREDVQAAQQAPQEEEIPEPAPRAA